MKGTVQEAGAELYQLAVHAWKNYYITFLFELYFLSKDNLGEQKILVKKINFGQKFWSKNIYGQEILLNYFLW